MAKFLIDFCQSHAMFIFVWVDVRASTRGMKWINLANQKCWWCRRMSGSWLETSKTYPIYCTSLHQTRIACQKHFFFSKGKLNSQTASQIGFFFSGFSFRFSFSYFLHFFFDVPSPVWWSEKARLHSKIVAREKKWMSSYVWVSKAGRSPNLKDPFQEILFR